MQSWIVNIVISFVLRQIAKFKKSIDWAKVKVDLDVRIRQLVPGTFFDAEAVAIVNSCLDSIQAILDSTDKIKSLLELLAQEKFAEATKFLIGLLMTHLSSVPLSESDIKVRNFLSDQI